MPNVLNQPFADALARQFPSPDGIKIFTAGVDAQKMLAFWSVKQTTKTVVLRVGNQLARFTLHSCPHCEQHLSAQAVKMSQKEREMIASLMAMMQQAQPAQPAGKPASKQANKPAKQAKPVQPAQTMEASESEELTMEELENLTRPA